MTICILPFFLISCQFLSFLLKFICMNTKKIIILIIAVAIIMDGYFLLTTKKINNGSNHGIDWNNTQVQIRDMSAVPAEYYAGNSRFSNGACQVDSDCFNIGCSLEMCSSDKSLMTTCEILGDFPDKSKYACGCIKDRCGWYPK